MLDTLLKMDVAVSKSLSSHLSHNLVVGERTRKQQKFTHWHIDKNYEDRRHYILK
jgi:hypothetical protein